VACWVHNCSLERGKYVKIEAPKGTVNGKQVVAVQEWLKAGVDPLRYSGILSLLADCIDNGADKHDVYCTFGITRSKDAVLLTVHYDGYKAYASGATLAEVSTACERLL